MDKDSQQHPSYQKVNLEDEKRLVEEAQKNLHKFQALYEIYFSKIYKYCYFHVYDPVEAEDICSQVFLKAIEAFPRFEWRGVSFGCWLYRIASNTVKNYYRDHKKTVSIDDVAPLLVSEKSTIVEDLSDAERKLVIKELLKNLAANCQEVLVLRFFEELAYKEVAERLEKTVAACKMQVKRCLERLKNEVHLKAPEIADSHPAFVE